jgi:2-dehydro-3-deoxyphosphogalactonate aldolase
VLQSPEATFKSALAELPLVAILRGIQPQEAVAIGTALVDGGWRLIEVPLNSPEPLESIRRMVESCPHAFIGAGTVTSAAAVHAVHDAGGRFVVAPNFDPAVVAAARSLGMVALPGVMSPSEAFAALQAGATGLKLFPAEMIPPEAVKALRSVLEPNVIVLPVGSISISRMAPYRAAGATGFGIGSALYKPGMSAEEVGHNAARWSAAYSSPP